MNWMKKLLFLVVALLGAGVLGLLALGMRSSAGHVNTEIEIARPASVVFPWLHEPEKVKQWVSWLKEIRPLTPGKDGVGAREVWVMEDRNNGNALMEIVGESTVFEPPLRLAAKLEAKGGFVGLASYELSETGGKTTVRSRSSFEYHHWLAKLFEPLITPEARKKLEGDLETLKRLIEAAPQ